MRKTNIFTLIELLIVIAVIAILASLLLPALQTAKQKAYESNCKGYLKQIGTAFIIYADTFDGWLVPQRLVSDGWPQILVANGCIPSPTDDYRGAAVTIKGSNKVEPAGVFMCPSAGKEWKDSGSGGGGWYDTDPLSPHLWQSSTYGNNAYLSYKNFLPDNSGYWEKLEKQTSAIYLATDGHGDGGAAVWATTSSYALGPALRHSNKFNALFCDGHVDSQKTISTSSTAPPWRL